MLVHESRDSIWRSFQYLPNCDLCRCHIAHEINKHLEKKLTIFIFIFHRLISQWSCFLMNLRIMYRSDWVCWRIFDVSVGILFRRYDVYVSVVFGKNFGKNLWKWLWIFLRCSSYWRCRQLPLPMVSTVS